MATGIKINDTFFSGAQASVFIGDVWVDDITSVNYEFRDSKQPVYGYGSEYFDLVAYGTKLVSGNFTVNFREPNYIWLILQREKELRKKNLQDESVDNLEDAISGNTRIGDKRKNYNLFFNTNNPDDVKKAFKQSLIDGKKVKKESINKMNHLGFNMVLGYGTELNQDTIGQRIIDAHIVGQSKVIMQDGRPIEERYQFFARDLR